MAVHAIYLKFITMLNYATHRRPSWGLSFLYTQACNTFHSVRESQTDRDVISNTDQKPANTSFLSSVSLLFLDVIGLTHFIPNRATLAEIGSMELSIRNASYPLRNSMYIMHVQRAFYYILLVNRCHQIRISNLYKSLAV